MTHARANVSYSVETIQAALQRHEVNERTERSPPTEIMNLFKHAPADLLTRAMLDTAWWPTPFNNGCEDFLRKLHPQRQREIAISLCRLEEDKGQFYIAYVFNTLTPSDADQMVHEWSRDLPPEEAGRRFITLSLDRMNDAFLKILPRALSEEGLKETFIERIAKSRSTRSLDASIDAGVAPGTVCEAVLRLTQVWALSSNAEQWNRIKIALASRFAASLTRIPANGLDPIISRKARELFGHTSGPEILEAFQRYEARCGLREIAPAMVMHAP